MVSNHSRILKSQVRIYNIKWAIVVGVCSSCRVYGKYKKSMHGLDLFHGGTPQNNFLHPEEPLPMRTFTGQKQSSGW